MKKQAIEKLEIAVSVEFIQSKIYLIRRHKVILDIDLAVLCRDSKVANCVLGIREEY